MSRPLVVTGLVLALALVACGGGTTSTTTTPPPDRAAVHWSRCPDSSYGTSVAGISCQRANHHLLDTRNSASSAAVIRTSDPSTFTKEGFDCTKFPLEDGFGWHIVCARGSRHISWYSTP